MFLWPPPRAETGPGVTGLQRGKTHSLHCRPVERGLDFSSASVLLAQEQSPGSEASLATMPEAPEVLEETVTVEEDPGTPTSHVSIVTSEDGTTRRTETKVGLGSGWGAISSGAFPFAIGW